MGNVLGEKVHLYHNNSVDPHNICINQPAEQREKRSIQCPMIIDRLTM
ncbi:hypothetical protein T02_196 [Trichinella nativa]|uniref:Uncharacterized protein n=1 Tax=Trichinella nativa TaxID=6335 RepID=A0A0V1KHB7_9BILA|nr:hypothetical protein T02_196 [Trichinella nativa]